MNRLKTLDDLQDTQFRGRLGISFIIGIIASIPAVFVIFKAVTS